mgnify:CR=1 FL=1
MKREVQGGAPFTAGAVELYTALLAAGETEISRKILKSTMQAAASVERLKRCDDCLLEQPRNLERRHCEELLKRSLFWICQVPDSVARAHGSQVFREALRLLLWLREEPESSERKVDSDSRLPFTATAW